MNTLDLATIATIATIISLLVRFGDRLWGSSSSDPKKPASDPMCRMEHQSISRHLADMTSVLKEHSELLRKLIEAHVLDSTHAANRHDIIREKIDVLERRLSELERQTKK